MRKNLVVGNRMPTLLVQTLNHLSIFLQYRPYLRISHLILAAAQLRVHCDITEEISPPLQDSSQTAI